jgi:hypothetical protein
VMQVVPLVQAKMKVGHRRAREPSLALGNGTRQTKNGRPDRSIAAVTSASSMGNVAEP